MERALIAMALIAVAVVVAVVMARRRPEPPTQPAWTVPAQLDRRDFARPDAPWLVAVFTSATCDTCAGVHAKAVALASEAVVVDEVEVGERPEDHRRYGIDAVPTTVVADAEGVVRASFVGPVGASELWAAVAEVRDGPPEAT